jgi:hypothetical protein
VDGGKVFFVKLMWRGLSGDLMECSGVCLDDLATIEWRNCE